VFERFSDEAREVVVLAQDEARALKHNYIGTEHLLLGLLRVGGEAARMLSTLDVTVEEVRTQVARIVGEGEGSSMGQIPFTPRAKKVLELSLLEAQSLGHDFIGPAHILLGLLREGQGVAVRILDDFDVGAEMIRDEMIRVGWTPHAFAAPQARPRWSRAHWLAYEPGSPLSAAPLAAAFLLGAAVFAGGLLAGWLIWG